MLFNDRHQLSRSALEEIADLVMDRLQRSWLSVPFQPEGAGVSSQQSPGQPRFCFPAKIAALVSSGAYTFTEVDFFGNLVASTRPRTAVAREFTGSSNVPIGATVWMWPAETVTQGQSEGFFLFSGNDGGGGGSGSIPSTRITFSGARLYHSVNQTIASVPGGTYLAFDSADFDTDSYHAGADNTRLTIPTTGYYQFGACVLFSISGQGLSGLLMEVFRNGTDLLVGRNLLADTGSSSSNVLSSSPFLELVSVFRFTAGDYIQLFANTAPGGTSAGAVSYLPAATPRASPVFWISRLGT